jgi:hypothetical protein
LSTRNSDEVYPASVKASFMYGASKSTHRVDDVVSGRITPTCRLLAPLVPAAASGLSWDIVDAMLTVKELMLRPDGTRLELLAGVLDEDAEGDVAGVDAGGVDDVADDEQPAATTAATAARATQPNRGRRVNVPWPCERGGHPLCPLLPCAIPDPFRHNALGYADKPGHRTTCVSLRDER